MKREPTEQPELWVLAVPIMETVEYWQSTDVKPWDVAATIGLTDHVDGWAPVATRLAVKYAGELGISVSERQRAELVEWFWHHLKNGATR